jgi:transposase
MNYKHFIGIDVSKNWLDFTVMEENQVVEYARTENNLAAIKEFFKKLGHLKNYNLPTTLVCMEHTGIYNNHLLNQLTLLGANICLESGLQIKQSSGLKRGKNDKVDSERIAMYAYKNRSDLKIWQPKRTVLNGLKHLTTLRNRLINVIKQLKTPLKEASEFIDKKDRAMTSKLCKNSLKALENDLKKLNEEIKSIIKNDSELNRLFNIVTSVTGVGPVTATELIITTNEFKSITCPKKYACYGGIAPFEHQSGSSIKGKTRVSSMGNKNVKKLLHLAALSATIAKGDMRIYYERKVAEGKNKMLILNAIRNKIVARVFACVKQNRLFEKNYSNSLFYP